MNDPGALTACRGGTVLRFERVNLRGRPGYRAGWQRHHLIPRQLTTGKGFAPMFAALQKRGFTIEDFRTNGMLLPARETIAWSQFLPMHRGPHPAYNELVRERVARVVQVWTSQKERGAHSADDIAHERLSLLQRARRRRLTSHARRPLPLNRNDPVGRGIDFSCLDTMADQLWSDTARYSRT